MRNTASPRVLKMLEQDGGLCIADIAALTNVPKTIVELWIAGEALPHPQSERIISDLSYVVQKLRGFYKPKAVRLWLYTQHPQLGGQRAVELIHSGRINDILTVVTRLEAEAYI